MFLLWLNAERELQENRPLIRRGRRLLSIYVNVRVATVQHRRQLRGLFSLLLLCLWITTASLAEHVSADFPLCQPEHLPCCPQPVNNTNESCPACHVSVLVAAKETQQQERLEFYPSTRNAPRERLGLLPTASRRELIPGLRHRIAVFDFKDDLRI